MPGTVVIVGAVLIHAGIGLRALFARRTLRLRPSEIAQLVLGLAIPYLLASYVIATRLLPEFHGVDVNFELVFAAYWISFPSLGIAQAVVLVVAWVHGCIGLHMWLRLKPWYPRLAPSALAIAVALPTLALAGYVAAGVEARALGGNEAWIDQLLATASYKPEMSDFVFANRDRFQIAFTIVVGAILLARYIRGRILVRQVAAKIHYRGRKTIDFKPGATLLEILWANGVPHASVCGGRGRCSTCRVRVGRGADWLDPPLEGEGHRASAHRRTAGRPASPARSGRVSTWRSRPSCHPRRPRRMDSRNPCTCGARSVTWPLSSSTCVAPRSSPRTGCPTISFSSSTSFSPRSRPPSRRPAATMPSSMVTA